MFQDAEVSATRRTTLTLTAWVSVCLLVAGLGSRIQPGIRDLWTGIGAIGLAAAVGLDVAARARCAMQAHRRQTTVQRRIEERINRGATKISELTDFESTLRQLAPNDEVQERRSRSRRAHARLPFRHPVRVQSLLTGESTPYPALNDAPVGHVVDISAHGVGFVHDQPLDTPHVVLTFDLLRDGIVSVMVELKWQKVQADGKYRCGGKLIKVMSPTIDETTAVLVNAG